MNKPLAVLLACLNAAVVRGNPPQEDLLDAAAEAITRPPSQMLPRNMDAIARWYARRGLEVFPLMPGAKRPLPGTNGLKDATTVMDTIGRMWDDPKRNIGIACGHRFDVIDIDGDDGCDTFIRLVADDPAAAPWLTIRAISQTPHGLHLWVPAVEGAINDAGNGVDYRAKGGYVVAPPSHVDGTLYRWLVQPTFT